MAPEQPHNRLPALPPAHELESRAVLKACNQDFRFSIGTAKVGRSVETISTASANALEILHYS